LTRSMARCFIFSCLSFLKVKNMIKMATMKNEPSTMATMLIHHGWVGTALAMGNSLKQKKKLVFELPHMENEKVLSLC
jgi:hypothetical protein